MRCAALLCRYGSALAVSARVATSLAELMYGEYGGDMEDYWRGAWEAAAGLPAGVAAAGSLREVRGRVNCYYGLSRCAPCMHTLLTQALLLCACAYSSWVDADRRCRHARAVSGGRLQVQCWSWCNHQALKVLMLLCSCLTCLVVTVGCSDARDGCPPGHIPLLLDGLEGSCRAV